MAGFGNNASAQRPKKIVDRQYCRCFSLSSEATAEGKFGRVAGNTGIAAVSQRLVAANHQASRLVQVLAGRLIESQSVNTRVVSSRYPASQHARRDSEIVCTTHLLRRSAFASLSRSAPTFTNVPFLLATQLESYRALSASRHVPSQRKNEGLQSAFTSIFPIVSHNGFARLEFCRTCWVTAAFDVKECQQRGLTFASPLRAKVRLVILDKESPTKPVVKEMKEQEVYMGEMPLMTANGSFVINGTERVIVSQLHRSPGVFFEHDSGKTHCSGKLLFSARIIPYRGSWLDFEFDPKDILFFRVDRRRKMPVTILLKAIGMTPEQILANFFVFDNFTLRSEGAQMEFVRRAPARRSRALRHRRPRSARSSSRRTSASTPSTCATSKTPASSTSRCRKTTCSAACWRRTSSTATPARSSPTPTTS